MLRIIYQVRDDEILRWSPISTGSSKQYLEELLILEVDWESRAEAAVKNCLLGTIILPHLAVEESLELDSIVFCQLHVATFTLGRMYIEYMIKSESL